MSSCAAFWGGCKYHYTWTLLFLFHSLNFATWNAVLTVPLTHTPHIDFQLENRKTLDSTSLLWKEFTLNKLPVYLGDTVRVWQNANILYARDLSSSLFFLLFFSCSFSLFLLKDYHRRRVGRENTMQLDRSINQGIVLKATLLLNVFFHSLFYFMCLDNNNKNP